MRQPRPALARFLMVWLVAVFVASSIGMGAAGTAFADGPAHVSDHAVEMGSDCPASGKADTHKTGHGACAMTVCCFSEASDPAAPQPGFELIASAFLPSVGLRLTGAEPERAKKPPKYT